MQKNVRTNVKFDNDSGLVRSDAASLLLGLSRRGEPMQPMQPMQSIKSQPQHLVAAPTAKRSSRLTICVHLLSTFITMVLTCILPLWLLGASRDPLVALIQELNLRYVDRGINCAVGARSTNVIECTLMTLSNEVIYRGFSSVLDLCHSTVRDNNPCGYATLLCSAYVVAGKLCRIATGYAINACQAIHWVVTSCHARIHEYTENVVLCLMILIHMQDAGDTDTQSGSLNQGI